MMMNEERPRSARARILAGIRAALLAAVALLSFAALILTPPLRPAALPLNPGDVTPRDLQAPYDVEYVSAVRTEEARLTAERVVPPVYTAPDPSIARSQIERLRAVLHYIDLVRVDAFSTPEQKAADMAAMSDLHLQSETIEQILALPQPRWEAIQQEALSVLERVMRNTIRADDLETIRRSVPSLVSLAMSEEEARLTAQLVMAFVVPNSLYSPELTEAARKVAREAVEPVVQSYKTGETIVRGGEIITPADYEALQTLGLIEPGRRIQDYLGAAFVSALSAVLIGLYFFRRRQPFMNDARSLLVIALIFLVFLAGARLTIPGRTIIPYLYPIPAVGLLLATLFGMESGLIFSLVIGVLAAYGLPNTLDLTLYYLLSTLVGVLTLGPARRFWAFFRAGLAVAAAGIAMILAYRLTFTSTDWIGLLTLSGAALFNGIASASLTLLLQYFLAQILGLTTALQLLEISRPETPLLQFFLRNAPGTYQHSLQVANLAEQAAERIGADALLTRVGALFHDVGKAVNPAFFIENQAPGNIDTHEDLDPVESAQAIIRHVTDGVTLARKHRLPRRMDDFILEHHGTMITRYQYNQAVEAAGGDASKVDIEEFRYPGSRPRSRETAVLMLADAAEARVRAENPKDEETLRAIIRSVVERAQKEGQLDHTQLTLRDLSAIVESFVTTLRGTYHPRIEYPKADAPSAATRNVPTTPPASVRK